MKKKVKFLMSVAGTGDPSPAELERKYAQLARDMTNNSAAAQAAGRPGKSPEEIESFVQSARRKDAKIPRVSGFTHEFSFRPNDEALVPAEIADKWEEAGICLIQESLKKAA